MESIGNNKNVNLPYMQVLHGWFLKSEIFEVKKLYKHRCNRLFHWLSKSPFSTQGLPTLLMPKRLHVAFLIPKDIKIALLVQKLQGFFLSVKKGVRTARELCLLLCNIGQKTLEMERIV